MAEEGLVRRLRPARKPGIWVGGFVVLLTLWVGTLYLDDARTVEQAIQVQDYLKGYCAEHGVYPESETLQLRFPALFPDQEWYYWPDGDYTRGAFQYPMSVPFPGAPGSSKLSEFLPVIYAYAVRDPCEGLTPPMR